MHIFKLPQLYFDDIRSLPVQRTIYLIRAFPVARVGGYCTCGDNEALFHIETGEAVKTLKIAAQQGDVEILISVGAVARARTNPVRRVRNSRGLGFDAGGYAARGRPG